MNKELSKEFKAEMKKQLPPGEYEKFLAKLEKDKEQVNHPQHYGGEADPYEAIKVIEAWRLNFNLGNTLKYISRAGLKGDLLEDLKKAAWYLNREIENLKVDKW